MKRAALILALMITAMASPVSAAYDCSKLKSYTLKQVQNEVRPADVQECQKRGWDIPVTWREGEGRTVSNGPSSGSTTLTARAPPEQPPGARGGKASVSQASFNLSLNFLKGFPCSLIKSMCADSSDGPTNPFADSNHNGIPDIQEDLNQNGIPDMQEDLNGNGIIDGLEDLNGNGIPDGQETETTIGDVESLDGSAGCAAAENKATKTDAEGNTVPAWVFGEEKPLGGSGGIDAPCGASLPMSIYSMSLTSNATHVYIAEAGNKTSFVYQRGSNGFSRIENVAPLPDTLCDGTGLATETPILPVAQVITYNASDGFIAIRLQSPDFSDEIDPFQVQDLSDPDSLITPTHFFIAPLQNGVPMLPAGCPLESNYLQTLSTITAPLTIIPINTPTCDGELSGSEPNKLFCPTPANTLTANGNSCDAVTLYPDGAACAQQVMYVPVDRPNFAFPAGSNVAAVPMAGRTAHVATSVPKTRLYLQTGQLVLFGTKGGGFVLPEGGVLALRNGETLKMNAPAKIDAMRGAVTLTNGGTRLNANNEVIEEIPRAQAGSPPYSIKDIADAPYAVHVNRSIELYEGLTALTEPQVAVRFPVNPE